MSCLGLCASCGELPKAKPATPTNRDKEAARRLFRKFIAGSSQSGSAQTSASAIPLSLSAARESVCRENGVLAKKHIPILQRNRRSYICPPVCGGVVVDGVEGGGCVAGS